MSDASGWLRSAGIASVGSLLQAVWGLKVSGLDRVPRTGPAIFACNHVSLLDPALVNIGLAPARRPWFLAKKELFANPVSAWFFRESGAIPLDRGSSDFGALRAALEVLGSGGSLALFPEGTRVRPGETRAPKAGVAFLSARARAPVVPLRAVGTDRFPRAFPLELRVGAPLPPAPEDRQRAGAYARAVMDAVYRL